MHTYLLLYAYGFQAVSVPMSNVLTYSAAHHIYTFYIFT